MCGIAGIYGASVDRNKIKRMIASQSHRGPDDEGLWIDESKTVAFGHNRLSIIDIHQTGHQPMTDGNGLWITFNGEIYNYIELKAELVDYPFKSNSDTEVILACYRKWGKDCVQKLKGIFSFAIWDQHSKELFCVRDRFGVKPFHYSWFDDHFYFGSEVKAILASGIPARPDYSTFNDYLVKGLYDHSSHTFFENINSLPAASCLLVRGKEMSIWTYWDISSATLETRNPTVKEAEEKLDMLIRDAVRIGSRADVPVAINLSGGLDSALLTELARSDQSMEDELTTFTSCYGDDAYDEVSEVRNFLKGSRIDANMSKLGIGEVPDLVSQMIISQDAPVGGISTLAYHKMHKLIKNKGYKVCLEGQGLDEIFAGYASYRYAYARDLFEKQEYKKLERLKSVSSPDLSNYIYGLGNSSDIDDHISRDQDGRHYLKPDCVSPDSINTYQRLINFHNPFTDHLRNAMYVDMKYRKLPRVLRMNDRLSMASGCELRPPFLDHDLVEYAFSLPPELKIKNGYGKYLVRKTFEKALPNATCWEEKRTVVAPQREWLRNGLKDYVLDILNSENFRNCGLFNHKQAAREAERFFKGEGDNSFFIWQWISVDMWFRRFNTSAPVLSSSL